MMCRRSAVGWLFFIILYFLAGGRNTAFGQIVGPVIGRPEAQSSPPNCISPADRKRVATEIAAFHKKYGTLVGSPRRTMADSIIPYAFHPQSGNYWQDLFTVNFVDLNTTSPGILDWDGTDWTYDGHDAHDVGIPGFDEQEIGVPIYAAIDGTVAAAHDGEEDHNTSWQGQPANYVILFHGGSQYSYYWHMRKGSVLVAVGQSVKAGQQIGSTGSSGNSTGPHLHFASYNNNLVYEPFAGVSRPGPSYWVHQVPIRRELYLRYFGLTTTTSPNLPWHVSRTGTFVSGVHSITYFLMCGTLPPNSTGRTRWYKPDGSLYYDSQTYNYSFSGRNAWLYSWYTLNWNVTGTWTLKIDFNGTTVVSAPFKIVSSAAEIVNRAPTAATGAFDPPAPVPSDVLFLRLNLNPLIDPDYDVVQYRYRWKVNGNVIRDVTIAGLSDCIPRNTAAAGDVVTCDVTPSDGTLDGPTRTFQVRVGPYSLWAWGSNYYGQLGNGTFSNTTQPYGVPTPAPVNGIADVRAVSAGGVFSLALRPDSSVWQWRANQVGSLGPGLPDNATPSPVSGLSSVKAIAAGYSHSLALRYDGTVWTWGNDTAGQLGNGTTGASFAPAQVGGLSGIVAIAAGARHSLALRRDGTVWAWGGNDASQLGIGADGTSIPRMTTPAQVVGLTNVIAIAAGGDNGYALKLDGTLWAWGSNVQGQLGQGAFGGYDSTPIQVQGLSDVIAVACGPSSDHVLALRADGTVWALGDNSNGSIGDGTKNNRNLPVLVAGVPNAVAVSCGSQVSRAVLADGGLWSWGANGAGEIGNGSTSGPVMSPVRTIGLGADGLLSSDGQGLALISGSAPATTTSLAVGNVTGAVGAAATLSATLTAGGSGLSGKSVSFTVDGVAAGSSSTNGSGVATVSYTPAEGTVGNHTIGAVFSGDTTYAASNGTGTLTVNKADTGIVVAPASGLPGDTITLKATLSRTSDGSKLNGKTLSFQVDGAAAGTSTTDSSGVATKSYTIPSTATPGPLAISASFGGDVDYNNTSGNGTLTVLKKTTLAVANVTGALGAAVNLTAKLTNASGVIGGATVEFFVDGGSVGTAVTNSTTGVATLGHTLIETFASHTLTAQFKGDSTNGPATGKATLKVTKIPTAIALPNPVAAPNTTINLTATLKAGTTLLANRTIEFFVADVSQGTTTTNSSGVATLSYAVTEPIGTYKLTAKYTGDATYAACTKNGTLTVKKLDTKTTPAAVTAKPGQTVTLKATVKAGSTPIVDVPVTFSVDGVSKGQSKTNSTGLATLPYKAGEGVGQAHTIKADFAGNDSYNPSSGSSTLTIVQSTTSLTGENLTAIAGTSVQLGAKLIRLTDKAPLAGQTVGFYDSLGTTLLGTGATDLTGRATFTVTAPDAGLTDKYVVKFAGDTNYQGSNGTASVKGQ